MYACAVPYNILPSSESINNDSRASHVFCRSDMTVLLRTSQYFLIRKGHCSSSARRLSSKRFVLAVSIVSRFLYVRYTNINDNKLNFFIRLTYTLLRYTWMTLSNAPRH
uniref:Uncharacterized protein n=1 Tax=Trichogramma kaykai TaxID=54128 RepID=A0ABD2X216_9HYME